MAKKIAASAHEKRIERFVAGKKGALKDKDHVRAKLKTVLNACGWSKSSETNRIRIQSALEEAGIRGKVSVRRIGRYPYTKWGGLCIVTVFLMKVNKVHDPWTESDRERRWVGISKAQRLVHEKKLRKLISKVPHLVTSDLTKLKKVDGYK